MRMMNKFILVFLFLFVGWGSVLLLSQNTEPVPTSFAKPKAETWTSTNPQQNLTKFPSNVLVRSDEVVLVAYARTRVSPVDSIFYPDTLRTSVGGETRYIVTLDSLGYGFADGSTSPSQDSLAFVTLRKITPTIDSSAIVGVWLNQANRNVVDNLGWTFNSNRMLNQSFEVDLLYDIPVKGKSEGQLATYSEPFLDSLTILAFDTLWTTADTVYSMAVPADYLHTTLFLDKVDLTGTASHFGFGYQLKKDGSWYGDLFNEGNLFVIDDTVYMAVGDTARAGEVNHAEVADSVRYVSWNKSALRTIFKAWQVLWRD